jgi:hypothetical protein
MANGKDSAEVVKFLSLLARLKDCCDDDPKGLSDLAMKDEGVKGLCNQLSSTAFFLRMNERRRRELFAAPVDPKFLTAWRDFEERFEKPLADFLLAEIFPGLSDIEPAPKWPISSHVASAAAKGSAIILIIDPMCPRR